MAPIAPARRRAARVPTSAASSQRLVMLATLGVRVDPAAERVALASAVETAAKLIVANVVAMPPYPTTLMLAREYVILPHEEDLEAVRATAQRAAAAGVGTELLRVASRRPVTSVIELAREREAGLLVFGPERSRMPQWRFRTAARAVRRRATCLVWITPER